MYYACSYIATVTLIQKIDLIVHVQCIIITLIVYYVNIHLFMNDAPYLYDDVVHFTMTTVSCIDFC